MMSHDEPCLFPHLSGTRAGARPGWPCDHRPTRCVRCENAGHLKAWLSEQSRSRLNASAARPSGQATKNIRTPSFEHLRTLRLLLRLPSLADRARLRPSYIPMVQATDKHGGSKGRMVLRGMLKCAKQATPSKLRRPSKWAPRHPGIPNLPWAGWHVESLDVFTPRRHGRRRTGNNWSCQADHDLHHLRRLGRGQGSEGCDVCCRLLSGDRQRAA